MLPIRSLIVLGTRPEAIKLAPVIQSAQRHAAVEPIVCSTGQHREMLQQVLDYFEIRPDLSLDLMQANQTLSSLTARLIESLQQTATNVRPDCIVAQGDTTTVMAAAMVSFYNRIPFVHVEAGLRTGNLQAPWPEEYNRRVAGLTTDVHCAPTPGAAENLRRESVREESIHVTGNTVIDALLWAQRRECTADSPWQAKYRLPERQRMVLITGHRRENFGEAFRSVCRALAELACSFPDIQFIYPVHLNPNVRQPVHDLLGNIPNMLLTDPAGYPEFIWLMNRCALIVTDSGGVQEEAPSLGKPVLVTRSVTERPEAVAAGAVELVGTDQHRIVEAASLLLTDEKAYRARQIRDNPYGDGQAARRIVQLIEQRSWLPASVPARRAA